MERRDNIDSLMEKVGSGGGGWSKLQQDAFYKSVIF